MQTAWVRLLARVRACSLGCVGSIFSRQVGLLLSSIAATLGRTSQQDKNISFKPRLTAQGMISAVDESIGKTVRKMKDLDMSVDHPTARGFRSGRNRLPAQRLSQRALEREAGASETYRSKEVQTLR